MTCEANFEQISELSVENVSLDLLSHEFVKFFFRGFDSEGVEVVRPYTPTTLDTDVGYFDLVVKVRLPS